MTRPAKVIRDAVDEMLGVYAAPAFDHANVRDINDVHPLPDFFSRRDGAELTGYEWLGHVRHGSVVADRYGARFRVMGYGAVQGSVTLRNRYRQMFYADIDQMVRVVAGPNQSA